MNIEDKSALQDYYAAAESWADDRAEASERQLRRSWIIAGLASAIALLEALALVILMPLKTVEPYAVLVDRQTGNIEQLNLAKGQSITPDAALIRAMLAQYVIAREEFNSAALRDDYRKVALWSAGDARSQYIAGAQASNPTSLLARLPRSSVLSVEIRSISPLARDSAMVRYATVRTDQGGQPVAQGTFVAIVTYRFSAADMSAASRLENPLGFQVLRYDRSAELPPAPVPAQPVSEPAASGPSAARAVPLQPSPAPQSISPGPRP